MKTLNSDLENTMWRVNPSNVLKETFYFFSTDLDLLNYFTVDNNLYISSYPIVRQSKFKSSNISSLDSITTPSEIKVVTESFLKDHGLYHPTIHKNKLNINLTNLMKSIFIQDYLKNFPNTDYIKNQLKEYTSDLLFLDILYESPEIDKCLVLNHNYFQYVDTYSNKIVDFFRILRIMLVNFYYVESYEPWLVRYPIISEHDLEL